jgi:hypothetical protein
VKAFGTSRPRNGANGRGSCSEWWRYGFSNGVCCQLLATAVFEAIAFAFRRLSTSDDDFLVLLWAEIPNVLAFDIEYSHAAAFLLEAGDVFCFFRSAAAPLQPHDHVCCSRGFSFSRTSEDSAVGVESVPECLDVPIEVRGVKDLIESRVKRVRRAPWQVLCATHMDVCSGRRRRWPIAMGDSVVLGIDRVDP